MTGYQSLLRLALILFGVVFCLIYPLAIIWPSGWAWHEGSPGANNYYMMIVGFYATLGIFLIRASGNPTANASLIWFTVWSSLVHAAIMGLQALQDPMHLGHLLGDVPALALVAVVLGLLMKRQRALA